MPLSTFYWICLVLIGWLVSDWVLLLITVDDSGVGQQQLNGTASKNSLQLLECAENQSLTSV